MKAFFLFPTFLPTPKPHLILPNSHSCYFSWTHFCQILVSHSLIKNAIISWVCTGLLFFLIQTSLKHLMFFKSKSGDFFIFSWNHLFMVFWEQSYLLQYKACLPIFLPCLLELRFCCVPQPQTEVCGLIHAIINMLHAVRSQTPGIVLPFSYPIFLWTSVEEKLRWLPARFSL